MKKFIAILLCAVLLTASVGLALPAAAPAELCGCGHDPVIQLLGGHGALTENYGTPEEKSYYGLDMLEHASRDLLPGLDGLRSAVLSFNTTAIIDAFIAMLDAWIGPLALNPDGTSASGKELDRYAFDEEETMAMDHRTGEPRYTFAFDWRRSPIETADLLDAYVQRIKEHTGHAHVHLESISGGGSVLTAYIDKYVNGVEDPDALSVVIGQCSGYGTPFVGHILNSSFRINPYTAGTLDSMYLLSNMDSQTQDGILGMMSALYNTGILDVFAIALTLMPKGAFDIIYEDLTRKTYAAWPGMWAWCPPEAYESAKARLTEGHPEYEELGFVAKIDAYHEMQGRAGDILKEASEKIKVAVMVGYDMSILPLDKDDNSSSDTLVPVRYASLGAVAAPFGKTLGFFYKQAVDDGHKHISPDNKVDASTCALPENTWFIKGLAHRGTYEYGGWYSWWRNAPLGADTVFDNPDFPQFMQVVSKSQDQEGPIVPVTGPDEIDMAKRITDMVLAIIRYLLELVIAPLRDSMNDFWGI